MGYLISAGYTLVDAICFLLFLDLFAIHRYARLHFCFGAACFFVTSFALIALNQIIFDGNAVSKILLIVFSGFLFARILYTEISSLYLFLIVVLEYLLMYLLSSGIGIVSAVISGVKGEEFKQVQALYIISSILYYLVEFSVVLSLKKFFSLKSLMRGNLKLKAPQLILYFMFPIASFVMLAILLYITGGNAPSEFIVSLCCFLIFAANTAVLFLLSWMERAEQDREQSLSLNQQLQLQAQNIKTICNLYSNQRKEVHDFRAHLNTISALLTAHEYFAAQGYIQNVTSRQSERIFLVSSHNPILDALLNTKAFEASSQAIELHFNVNNLSNLPFDSSDIVVLLSNLLDNAIEACVKCEGKKVIEVAIIKKEYFFFSIRNTSIPVKILNDAIPTTKQNPQEHGFGLSNVKRILEKYQGEYAMEYKDGWFQFVGEIRLF